MLQGEQSVHADFSSNGFLQDGAGTLLPGVSDGPGVLPRVNPLTGTPYPFGIEAIGELELFLDQVNTYDQPVATPAMLNNSYGARLELSLRF